MPAITAPVSSKIIMKALKQPGWGYVLLKRCLYIIPGRREINDGTKIN
jgi:hypothetical protein